MTQPVIDFFPSDIGNRWLYRVDGVANNRDGIDTLAAEVEWEILEVIPESGAEVLRLRVTTTHNVGERDESICWMNDHEQIGSLYGSSIEPSCDTRSGFPFYRGAGPFWVSASQGVQDFEISGESYSGEMTEGSQWYPHYFEGCTRTQCTRGWVRRVRADLAAGIGAIKMEGTYDNNTLDGTRRDTIRSVLLGADIGGVLYGDIQPVASEESASPNELAIRAGPNPADAFATVWIANGRREQEVELTVMDVLGREVRTARARSGEPIRLDVSGLPPGVYILSAEANRQRVQTRLVVQR